MKLDYKVIIAGSRTFSDYDYLSSMCLNLLRNKLETSTVIIMSGHAPGADLLGERFAKDNYLDCWLYPAEWGKYGKSAGYRRNCKMAETADALIAFWDGESKGTEHMIEIAKSKNLDIRVITY